VTKQIKDYAKDLAAYIVEVADASLKSKAVTGEDLEDLKHARRNFVGCFTQLAELIDTFEKNEAEFGYQCLCQVVSGAFIVGSRGTVAKSANRALMSAQAAFARASGAQKRAAQEQALLAAINQVHPGAPCARPSSMAAAKLVAINRYLKAAGFAPVKKDAVYRRLKNLARS